jgi:sn-glycerol 3-phosphate transport system permease protein
LRNPWLPYLLVLPQVAVTLLFFLWLVFDSLPLSLFKASPIGERLMFVGLENFRRLLFAPDYHRSPVSSFVFAGGITCLGLLIALFRPFSQGRRSMA